MNESPQCRLVAVAVDDGRMVNELEGLGGWCKKGGLEALLTTHLSVLRPVTFLAFTEIDIIGDLPYPSSLWKAEFVKFAI